jgi:hypothetical protein
LRPQSESLITPVTLWTLLLSAAGFSGFVGFPGGGAGVGDGGPFFPSSTPLCFWLWFSLGAADWACANPQSNARTKINVNHTLGRLTIVASQQDR